MTRRQSLAIALCATLAACQAHVPPEHWAGTVTPNPQSKTCQPSRGTVTITEHTVLFAPNEGTWILTGIVAPDGAITADRATQNAGQAYETALTAKRSETAITGTYTTPRCTFAVRLARV